jgi:hypothetical protein
MHPNRESGAIGRLTRHRRRSGRDLRIAGTIALGDAFMTGPSASLRAHRP